MRKNLRTSLLYFANCTYFKILLYDLIDLSRDCRLNGLAEHVQWFVCTCSKLCYRSWMGLHWSRKAEPAVHCSQGVYGNLPSNRCFLKLEKFNYMYLLYKLLSNWMNYLGDVALIYLKSRNQIIILYLFVVDGFNHKHS